MEMYFAQAETEVEKMGYLSVGPMEQITNRTSLEFRIHRFTGCEAIYVLKGFGDQYDERIEFGLIQSLGIKIIYQK